MTVEYKGFKIGDQVRFTEEAVKPFLHKDTTKGIVVGFDEGDCFEFLVRAANGSCVWYGETEIELLGTVVKQQTTLLDEHTVITVSKALSEIYAIHGITDGEIVAAVAAYLRGLQEGMGIDKNI